MTQYRYRINEWYTVWTDVFIRRYIYGAYVRTYMYIQHRGRWRVRIADGDYSDHPGGDCHGEDTSDCTLKILHIYV